MILPTVGPDWLALLLDLSLRATAVLLIALGVTLAMKRASAATRHLVWSVALLGVILLPALERLLPALPLLPRVGVATSAIGPLPAPGGDPAPVPPSATPRREADPSPSPAAWAAGGGARLSAAPLEDSRGGATLDPWRVGSLVWLGGAGLVLLRLLAGLVGVWWLGRRATMVTDGGWLHLVHDLARRLGLSRGVTLLRGTEGSAPMTWGVLQPIIWLPPESEAWTPERRTVVLAHELAHVRRRDALTQWIAHLAVVIHWFNPLVWLAARRLREERERACDDAVLSIGTRPSVYADHLLEIVRSYGERNGPTAAMAMARRSQFEGRLLAILDRAARRGGIGRSAALVTAAYGLLVVLPAASLRAGQAPDGLPAQRVAGGTLATTSAEPTGPSGSTAATAGESALARPLSGRDGAAAPAPVDTIPASPAQRTQVPVSLVSLIAEIGSDGEKAALLMRAARLSDPSPEVLLEVVRAARTISSSGDRAGVLLAVLQQPRLSPAVASAVLEATAEMSSGGDQVSVLLPYLGKVGVLDDRQRDLLLRTIGGIPSSGDRATALVHLLQKPGLTERDLVAAFRTAGEISSDGDAALVLTHAAQRYRDAIRGEVYESFLAAVRTIESDGDRSAVLSALLEPARPRRRAESAGTAGGRAASWSAHTSLTGDHNGEPSYRLELMAEDVVLNEAGDAVVALGRGGSLRVSHTLLRGYPDPDPLRRQGSGATLTRTLQVTRSGTGELRFDYAVDGQPREFGSEGRAWLARVLTRFRNR